MPFEPLRLVSTDELESIHNASLRVLSEIGMEVLSPSVRERCRQAGAAVETDGERIRFDPVLVESLIGNAPSSFTLHARNPEHHVRIGDGIVNFSNATTPPNSTDL